jgi:hypothetical protein
MKKILLSAVAVMAFGFANAQETTEGGFSQGDVFISGSVGYSSAKEGDDKTDNVSFSPMAAYFLTENIALGGQLSVSSGTSDFGAGENKNSSFSILALGRYYFTPKNKFSLFGQAQAGYLSTKDEPAAPADEIKRDGFQVGVGVGMNYFVSSHFALEANLGLLNYQSTKADTDGAESRNVFNFGLNMTSVNIGVLYKF